MSDQLKIKFSKPDKGLHLLNDVGSIDASFDSWDSIPNPVPAKRAIPDWFKNQSSFDEKTNLVKTVKKCPPFLDALTTVYTINFCSELDINVKNRSVSYDGPGKVFCSIHTKSQYEKTPIKDKIVLKFSSPWVIETPPGWSCLFLHPLNDFDSPFETIAGIVDTDTYRLPVNFPFVLKENNIRLTRETKMVQIIPFRRQEFSHEIGTVNYQQWKAHQDAIGDNWNKDGYKEHFHQKKKYN